MGPFPGEEQLSSNPSTASAHTPDALLGTPRSDAPPPPKKRRVRTGCFNCRRRHRKCDENRPTCLNCNQRGETCEWGLRANFRADNSRTLEPEHPSMTQEFGGSRNPNRQFKILNVTSDIVRNCNRGKRRRKQSQTDSIKELITTASGNSSEDADGDEDDRSDMQSVSMSVDGDFPSLNPRKIPRSSCNGMTQFKDRQNSDPGISRDAVARAMEPYPFTPLCFSGDASGAMTPTDTKAGPSPGGPYQRASIDASSIHLTHRMSGSDASCSPHPGQANLPQPTMDFHRTPSSDSASPEYHRTHPDSAVANLLALRYVPPQQIALDTAMSSQAHESPTSMAAHVNGSLQSPLFEQQVFNDMFLSGSVYEEFSTTLRNRMMHTTKGTTSPDQEHAPPDLNISYSADSGSGHPDSAISISCPPEIEPTPRSARSSELTLEREYILMKNYLDEVASWLDMFDNERHFEHAIPMMAKESQHLKLSILALSARQMERRYNKQSSSESLALYQEAIHQLLPEIESKSSAVTGNPKDWRRHLDGCAILIQDSGTTGFCGGTRQALFWCFARMGMWFRPLHIRMLIDSSQDVCGAFISEEETIIPTHRWIPESIPVAAASALFKNPANDFDSYANYAVFLAARVLDITSSCRKEKCSGPFSPESSPGNYAARWLELFELVEDWHAQRPEQLKPIMTIPSGHGEGYQPFPTILYGNGSSISGNQLYHTCALLLLQGKPRDVRLSVKPKSILWHARQIVGISASNSHHGCWTNSLQPLWFAGKVMSHRSEHEAVLEVLSRIERETGWSTSWRADDLKEFWGDLDN
ncbi:MAG: hypothetical protein M1834_007644 [Cirrosporium novae-zelandiae]|nr:MAG: hypothetical protein M1834_007644 [Cirrosporium novae-zelandiae]